MKKDRGRLKTRERTKEDTEIDAGKQKERDREIKEEKEGIEALPMASTACSWFPEPSFRLVFETFHNKDVK